MERALETRRLRLLRLLAGLLLVVGFVSSAPSSEFRRWIACAVTSALFRAELAVQYLVIVQARLIARRIGSDVDRKWLFDCAGLRRAEDESAVSFAVLRQRILALRAVLSDISRQGRRLLRRAQKAMRHAARSAFCAKRRVPNQLARWRLCAAHPERPPDKNPELCAMRPPPLPGGRRRRLGVIFRGCALPAIQPVPRALL